MNSLKIIIPVLLILILAAAGIYTIYQAQIANNLLTSISSPTPNASGFPTQSQSPSPAPAAKQSQNTVNVQAQPNTGPEIGIEIKNEGIQVNTPIQNTGIKSPLTITGSANVTSQKIAILILDTNGNVLGQGQASACVGLDACPFEASIVFSNPTTANGTIKLYSPSELDGSRTYPTSIPVTF